MTANVISREGIDFGRNAIDADWIGGVMVGSKVFVCRAR